MNGPEWRDVPGYGGAYQVSDHGEIRSVDRISARGHRVKGRVLRPSTSDGYARLSLYSSAGERSFVRTHCLVMLAFVGPCPDGLEVLHSDGDGLNNRLSNLSYGTRSQNSLDAVRHGTHRFSSMTHCKRGHKFTPENTFIKSSGSRECRACRVVRARIKKGLA